MDAGRSSGCRSAEEELATKNRFGFRECAWFVLRLVDGSYFVLLFWVRIDIRFDDDVGGLFTVHFDLLEGDHIVETIFERI